MGHITHPTLGSPCALVSPYGELIVNGSRSIDPTNDSMRIITNEHSKIHQGEHFNLRGFSSINSGGTLNFGVTTPNGSKWCHLVFTVDGTTQTEVYGYEGATLSGGTILSGLNNNRNSPTLPTLQIRRNVVISGTTPTSGLLIESHSKGREGTNPSEADSSSSVSREDEWILKSGTTYLWTIISQGSGNIIDFSSSWYENTDKLRLF